jgi:putative oxidoreductase
MPQALMLLVGRACLAALFILDGWIKLRGYGAAAGALRGEGVPFVAAVLPLTIAVELVGGLAVLVGYKARLAAYVLIILRVALDYYSSSFARAIGAESPAALLGFVNQLAIIAGLLLLAAAGPGKLSLDRS